MTSAFSWQNSVSLCPASFCTPRPNLAVTAGVSQLPTFTFQYPMMNITFFFFWCLVFRSLLGLHRTQINVSFFSTNSRGIDFNYSNVEWLALETDRDHSFIFWMHPSTDFWTPSLIMRATPFLLWDFCPQQQI